MKDLIKYTSLFDIYGTLLTDNQQDIFKLYYEENLSLQEISQIKEVSKSFIGKSVSDSEKKLEELESKLHILEKSLQFENIKNIKDNDLLIKKINEFKLY